MVTMVAGAIVVAAMQDYKVEAEERLKKLSRRYFLPTKAQ